MNYSRRIRQSAMTRRIIMTWAAVAVVSFLAGGCCGYVLHCAGCQGGTGEVENVDKQAVVFGAYEGSVTTHEIALDWGGDELEFAPLECGMAYEQQEFLYYLCSGYGLDFPLVMAVIQQESNFDPAMVSPTEDYGLMQINIHNHGWLTDTLGLTDFLDPYENMRCGCFVLRRLFEKYQDTGMVLMAYNMGEHGAARLWEEGIYETNYTHSVLTIQEQFYRQMEEGGQE